MSWDYGYDYYDGFGMVAGVFIGALVLGLLLGLALYFVRAVGLYKMSKNRGYRNAWLAFIPFANAYVLGGVADNISVCYGKKSSWRIWMLVLSIVNGVLGGICTSVMVGRLGQMLNYLIYAVNGNIDEDHFVRWFMQALSPVFAITSLLSLLGLACAVISYVVLYKVYQDYSNNAVLFLVLTILFPIVEPFFLFSMRNSPSASMACRARYYQGGSTPSGGFGGGNPVYGNAPSAYPTGGAPQQASYSNANPYGATQQGVAPGTAPHNYPPYGTPQANPVSGNTAPYAAPQTGNAPYSGNVPYVPQPVPPMPAQQPTQVPPVSNPPQGTPLQEASVPSAVGDQPLETNPLEQDSQQ